MGMDRVFKNMDFLVKHWAPFPRRFPAPFRVVSANYIRGKNEWVRRTFDTCNFSLILRGRGEFRRAGQTWTIQAPCVLTQWPGEYVEYGPPIPEETWDELYLIYDARLMSKFKQSRLIDPAQPVWPIGDIAAVNAQIAELETLANSQTPEAVVDRVDRVCERLILETHLVPRLGTEGEQTIHRLIAEVQRNPGKRVDFEELAMRHGMSASTFRRQWAAAGKLPPARFLQQLRVREACRLLAETMQPINEIAHAVGFDDELYFSRRFRKEMQMAPRDYRNAYHIRRSGGGPESR